MYELHALADVFDDEGCLIVKFNVAVESQPAAFVPVHVLTPLVL